MRAWPPKVPPSAAAWRYLAPAVLALLLCGLPGAFAQTTLDTIGVTQLRALDPTLTGTGVAVAQPEALVSASGFEVNPAATGQAVGMFTYSSTNGTITGVAPPNIAGGESTHADQVGDIFYGRTNSANPEGLAPGVSSVANQEADYFINDIIVPGVAINARVVNQSFVDTAPADAVELDQDYDNYVAYYHPTIVSAVGNGGAPESPGTAYNVIGVAAYGGYSSVGPTQYDTTGRSKPDITAPASATSYSTPLVSGAAAILIEAGARGDGGSTAATEAAATDSRTVKALLLNGAVKPADWMHTSTAPLDPRYGAGVLNVYNSYLALHGGRQSFEAQTAGVTPPAGAANTASLDAWDYNSITSSSSTGQTNHYLFDLTSTASHAFTLTSTLVWNRQFGQSGINNLDLYLYDLTTGTQVDESVSTVDNVQELYDMALAPDRYDLEVYKPAGTVGDAGTVSNEEDYSLAFDFAAVPEAGTWLPVAAAAACGLGLSRRRRRV